MPSVQLRFTLCRHFVFSLQDFDETPGRVGAAPRVFPAPGIARRRQLRVSRRVCVRACSHALFARGAASCAVLLRVAVAHEAGQRASAAAARTGAHGHEPKARQGARVCCSRRNDLPRSSRTCSSICGGRKREKVNSKQKFQHGIEWRSFPKNQEPVLVELCWLAICAHRTCPLR